MKWEYKFHIVKLRGDLLYIDALEEIAKEMNKFGNDRWELITFYKNSLGLFEMIFKRRIVL